MCPGGRDLRVGEIAPILLNRRKHSTFRGQSDPAKSCLYLQDGQDLELLKSPLAQSGMPDGCQSE